MIRTLHGAVASAVISLVGFALPAVALPVRHVVHQHPGVPPIALVDCSSDKNVCYLRMNACLYQSSVYPNSRRAGEYRACEAAYFDCISRFKCQRGPVW